MYMGTVIAMPLAGILAQYVSWEAIFYVFGKPQYIESLLYILINLIIGLLALFWCLL